MINPAHRWLLLFTLTALGACGTNATLAPWQRDPGAYPADDYLRASGTGADQASAHQRALANLAQIFSVTISDQGVDFTQSRSGPKGSELISRTGRTIDSFTEQVLEGARVVEYWQDPEGQHYALAVLEKAPAAHALRRRIATLERDSSSQVQSARSQSDPLAALRLLEQARQMLQGREALARKADVLGPPASPPRFSVAALEQEIRDRLQRLPVSLDMADARLRQPLQSALAALGIPLESGPSYRLQAHLGLEPVKWEQGWYWQRGALELVLTHGDGDRALASRRWPVKVAATDQTLVEERLLTDLSAVMPDYIYQLLTRKQADK